ncbi:MAG: type I secretion system permease/ATPase [Pseudomonadota bacterium]
MPHNVPNPLVSAFHSLKTALLSVGLFSMAINLLMLTGPLFMLQVYDRVLASRSIPTLLALFLMVAVLYLFLGLFDFIRSRILSRSGYRLEVELMGEANRKWIFAGLETSAATARPIEDLGVIRQFFCSNGPPALFDLPWVPVYLGLVFMLHVWLGLVAALGALIVIVATIVNELVTRKPIAETTMADFREARFAESENQDAEAIIAMGMEDHVSADWKKKRLHALALAQVAGGRSELIQPFTKAMRLLVQSGILAVGACLVIFGEISAGAMIASSIIAGRALAPIDAAVGNWRSFIRSRQAYSRLSKALEGGERGRTPVELPQPKGVLTVKALTKMVGHGARRRPIVHDIQFALQPGDGLGVIGASGSGKSSLSKLLIGLWQPDRGEVRLDGATFDQWRRDRLGRYVGYLPQNMDLMATTIRQNIARFDSSVTDAEIVDAAKLAGCHEMILSLPDGYETDLAQGRAVLSGGQAQRVALARAFLRFPRLVVLDEPNASLDSDGEAALINAIRTLRERGSCVIVMAHRPSALAAVNKILMLRQGEQAAFGEKSTVMRQLTKIVTGSNPTPPRKRMRPGSIRQVPPHG